MRQGEVGIGDGAVISSERAGVKGQRVLAGMDIGVPCGGGRRGQREAEAICQHHESSMRPVSEYQCALRAAATIWWRVPAGGNLLALSIMVCILANGSGDRQITRIP